MKSKEIYDAVDAVAPFALSKAFCDAFGHYDNSGLLLDCGREFSGVLFALDLSRAAVEAAVRAGAGCIVTHHPAIYRPVGSLHAEDPVLLAAQAGISVVSAHLNLDTAEGGIDECLMEGLGGTRALAFAEEAGGGAYGRVYTVSPSSLADFAERAARVFCTERLTVYGGSPVSRVASFCGAGLDEGALTFAIREGADTVVSADGKHHLIADAVEHGLNVVLLTHYASEWYGFSRFAEKIIKIIGTGVVFRDDRLL